MSALAGGLYARNEWRPYDAKGCKIWLSSTSVSQSSGNVDQMNDISRLATNHATSSGSRRPTYSAGPPTTITFNGSSQSLDMDNVIASGALTFGCVWKLTTSSPSGLCEIFRFRHSSTQYFALDNTPSSLTNYHRVDLRCLIQSSGSQAILGINGISLDTNYHSILVSYTGGSSTDQGSYNCYYDTTPFITPGPGTGSGPTGITGTDDLGSVGCYTAHTSTRSAWAPMILKDLFVIDRDLYTDDIQEFSEAHKWLNSTARTSL